MKIEAINIRQIGESLEGQIPTSVYEFEEEDGTRYLVTATTQEGLDKVQEINRSLDPDERLNEDVIVVDDPKDQEEVLQAVREIERTKPQELERLITRQDY